MAPTCPSSPGYLAVRLPVWYCPPSPHLWQANSNPSASHQTPQIDAVHWGAVRQIHQKSDLPSDGFNERSGGKTNIYTYIRDWLHCLILKNFSECAIFHPGSILFLLFHYRQPDSRAWMLPEFSSDLNFRRSPFHSFRHHQPNAPPLHQPSFFSPPRTHPSVLHGEWQQLLQKVAVEGETGYQHEMEKEVKSVFNISDKKNKCFDFITKAWCQFPWQHTVHILGRFNGHILFTHNAWKL